MIGSKIDMVALLSCLFFFISQKLQKLESKELTNDNSKNGRFFSYWDHRLYTGPDVILSDDFWFYRLSDRFWYPSWHL